MRCTSTPRSTARFFTALAALALVAMAAACVKGNPDVLEKASNFDDDGGSITLADCGYTVTTRLGAEAPEVGRPLFGNDPAPRHVHLGIAGDPRFTMAITWRTGDQDTLASSVRFTPGRAVPAADLDRRTEGFTFRYQGGFTDHVDDRVRIHEVHLCGLEPDTEYSYQVGGGSAWSPVYTFRTAPGAADGDAEVVLGVVGDTRGGYDVWQQVVDQLASRVPDLILFSGDAVFVGPLQSEWDEFFDRGEELFATTPVVSAHGNHDFNSVNYFSQFAMPGDEENYSLDYGPVHLTVLNDTPVEPTALSGSIKEFLNDDLGAHKDARWKLVMHHRPPWSSSDHGSDELLQREWGPIIDRHDVDLVLSGHDHNYERTVPLRGGGPVGAGAPGTVYVVSGGAGAPLYLAGKSSFTAASESTHGALVLRVRDTIVGEAFRHDGTMVDSFTLK